MSADDVFDERLQFFLRNRDDIKEWAAIELDVAAATGELLGRSQPSMEERLLGLDPAVVVGRHDSGPWQRILARHADWPPGVGLTLEWHRTVVPLGSYPPKLGVFWWADPPTLVAPRTRLTQVVATRPLNDLGFRVPLEGVWPVGMRFHSRPDWWQDPDTWLAGMLDRVASAWPIVAPAIDEVIAGVEWQVSDG